MPSISTTTRQRRHRTSRYARPVGLGTTTWRSGSGSPRRRHMRREVELVERLDAVGDVAQHAHAAGFGACRAGHGRAPRPRRRRWSAAAGRGDKQQRRLAIGPCPQRGLHGRDRRPDAGDAPVATTSSSRHRRVSWRRTPAGGGTGWDDFGAATWISPSPSMPSSPAACKSGDAGQRGAGSRRRSPVARTRARRATTDDDRPRAAGQTARVCRPSGRHRSPRPLPQLRGCEARARGPATG